MSHATVFAVFLGVLAALLPISIDMALPALADVAHAMHATVSRAGLTLSLFMLGFVIGPLAYGPLSDALGRRLVLLAGLSIFTSGGPLATLSPSIELLWAACLVQGLGAGAGMTLALAIVRDRFEGEAMQRHITSITVVSNMAPVAWPRSPSMRSASAGCSRTWRARPWFSRMFKRAMGASPSDFNRRSTSAAPGRQAGIDA
jgi:DHA1 family bicyclomycin/chloramphenicol resistance-like MFS transporter